MKLLVLAPQPFFQNRGTPIATLKMLHVLAANGHEIDLLTYHEGSPVEVENCRHLRIPQIPFVRNVPPGFSIRKLICDVVMTIQAFKLCFQHRYHVIHAVEESVFMAMWIKWIVGVPYIYDMDSSLPNQMLEKMPFLLPFATLMRLFEKMAVRHSRGVVAVCQALEDVATSHSNQTPTVRIEDASLLTEGSSQISPDDLLNIPGRSIMYVGNLAPYQGIDLLLDGFTHVYHRYPDAHLVIIGGSHEDIQRYKAISAAYQISDRTHFLGPRPVDQLGQYLQHADVLVSPRTMGNNTPMKVYSYLESGVPVLATKLSMHTQVLDNDIALLVAATPLDMARGMCTLLEDQELRHQVSDAAKHRIQEQYAPEQLASRLTEFYDELATTLGVNEHA